jgi:hypothetical protein
VLASSFQSHYAQLRFSLVRPAPPIRASALGERLGAFSMRLLVRKFLFDVLQPITNHGGEIYLYKGDGLIAVTPTARLSKNSRWIEGRFHKGDIVIGQIDTMLRCSTRV